MSPSSMSDIQLGEVEALSAQATKLTVRRAEVRAAWAKLRVAPAGSAGNGHRTFATLASLGAQLVSVEDRISELSSGINCAVRLGEA